MKRILSSFFAILAATVIAVSAQCDLRIGVGPISQGENVPAAIERQLQSRVLRALARNGVSAGNYGSQFFVAARFDNGFEDVTSGTAPKYVIKTVLTLYIADTEGQVYSAWSTDLKGVGDSQERAYMRCLDGLKASSPDFVKFVDDGRDKIVEYFNNNYPSYIDKARTAMNQRNYDDAAYYVSQIPECCNGWDQAQALALKIYEHSTDYDAATLLAKAEAAWAADPTDNGAAVAGGYLAQIDPNAACRPQAEALMKKMSRVVKANWDYENITKVEMAHEREKMRIKAAQAIGVAAAQNRPKTVYKFVYPRGYYYY